MRATFRLLLLVLLLQGFSSPARAAEGAGKVVLGQISLSFYAVTGAVVCQVLERLGHSVEIVQGSHGQIFPRLGAGEVDLLVAAWLPYGHATYWERYGSQSKVLAVLYEGARFAWMVPEYVPASLVGQVDDLKKPEVLARMEKTIQGTGRDSGNMIMSADVMRDYGLEAAGYQLRPGTLAEFHGNYDRAIAARAWFVMPLWFPHFINRVGDMRPIDEPKGLLGQANQGSLVASRAWVERAPEKTLRVLHRMHLGMDAVEAMDYAVNREKKTPQEAARAWMQKNQSTVETWFAQP